MFKREMKNRMIRALKGKGCGVGKDEKERERISGISW